MAEPVKKLTRSKNNKMLFGVCAGLAEYFNADPTMVRLVFAAATVFTFGTAVLVYIIAAIIMPEQA